jgi:hypothetical protein
MAEMNDFQKQFFAKGTQATLFTQKEFDDALEEAKTEIMAFAIDTVKQAVLMEREACAKLVEEYTDWLKDDFDVCKDLVEKILNRIPSQRQ